MGSLFTTGVFATLASVRSAGRGEGAGCGCWPACARWCLSYATVRLAQPALHANVATNVVRAVPGGGRGVRADPSCEAVDVRLSP